MHYSVHHNLPQAVQALTTVCLVVSADSNLANEEQQQAAPYDVSCPQFAAKSIVGLRQGMEDSYAGTALFGVYARYLIYFFWSS